MPDSSQANPTSDDNSTKDAVPNLGNLEYSTPSAYVDPALSLASAPAEEPKEEPAEEPKAPEAPEAPAEPEEIKPEEPAESEEPAEPEEPAESKDSAEPETLPEPQTSDSTMSEVAGHIRGAQNILIALSSDPSIDELASAIGLSLFLGRLDKRAIAIYTGTTPDALKFLKPEQTFKSNLDALQDFVIAIDKNKADHLRYKLDGSFVKIFVTPFKSRITSEDLDFSYGDYNIDLVLALNVHDEGNVDAALREHSRLMHDATVVNIAASAPGSFGDVVWADPAASSIAEMVTSLILNMKSGTKLSTDEATAFLTGIVAATNHYAVNTKPTTMQIASELMKIGADPELVASGVSNSTNAEAYSFAGENKNKPAEEPKPEPTPTVEPAQAELSIPAPALGDVNKYSDMLNEALAEPTTSEPAPMESSLPPVNPAASSAPAIEPVPEIPNIPDINFGQTSSEQVLPPPPAPPIDMNSPMPLPTPTDLAPMPELPSEPAPALPNIPAAEGTTPEPTPEAPSTPPAPDAFTIPGI